MRKWVRIRRRDQILPSIPGSAPSSAPNEVGTEGRLHRRQGKALKSESISMVREELSGKQNTSGRCCVGYVDLLMRSLGHCSVVVCISRCSEAISYAASVAYIIGLMLTPIEPIEHGFTIQS